MRNPVLAGLAIALLLVPSARAHDTLFRARSEQVTSLNISADLGVGRVVPRDVRVLPLIGDRAHGCFRAHGRVYIVHLKTRKVVALLPG